MNGLSLMETFAIQLIPILPIDLDNLKRIFTFECIQNGGKMYINMNNLFRVQNFHFRCLQIAMFIDFCINRSYHQLQ